MKWYALGLNDEYRAGLNFKNIAITDNEDISKSSFVIWDRIWKDSEAKDIKRIKSILFAGELIEFPDDLFGEFYCWAYQKKFILK